MWSRQGCKRSYRRTRDITDWTITLNPEYTEPKFITYRDIVIWVFGVIGGVASMLIYDSITSNNGDKNKQGIESTQTGTEQQRQQSESVSTADSTEIKIVPADSSKTN